MSSRASFGRSQIVAHMGLFGLALVVPCLSRSKNCESRELRRRSRGFSGVRSVLGAATHAAGGQIQSSGISGTLVSAWEEPYRTVAAVHTGLVGLKSPVATPMPWFTTRAVGGPPTTIGGHVPSGTSRPSGARVRAGGAKPNGGRIALGFVWVIWFLWLHEERARDEWPCPIWQLKMVLA